MYFPKNKIETNLYSSGDLLLESTRKPYYGFYFKTFEGNHFTGKEPYDGKNQRLIIPKDISNNLVGSPSQPVTDLRYEPENLTYTILQGNPPLETNFPTPFTPQPTEKDYQTGEITRAFAKKTNENIYYEIQSGTVITNPIYAVFSLQWVISGKEDIVSSINKNTIALYMRQLPIPAFNKFLKNDYLKFWKPS